MTLSIWVVWVSTYTTKLACAGGKLLAEVEIVFAVRGSAAAEKAAIVERVRWLCCVCRGVRMRNGRWELWCEKKEEKSGEKGREI
jgi:hypothetical protein